MPTIVRARLERANHNHRSEMTANQGLEGGIVAQQNETIEQLGIAANRFPDLGGPANQLRQS
jgi:hypothetical protein